MQEPLLPRGALDVEDSTGQMCTAHAEAGKVDGGIVSVAARAWGDALRGALCSPEGRLFFDSTAARSERLYAALTGGSDSPMDLLLFGKALEAERFTLRACDKEPSGLLASLFSALSGGRDSIDLSTFHAGLQSLKLEVLLHPGRSSSHNHHVSGWCWDWSAGKSHKTPITKIADMRKHLLSPRGAQYTMRWLHFEEPDELTALQLGVKYQLHLYFLSVCHKENVDTRLWVRGSDYHIVLPVLQLARASMEVLEEYRAERSQARLQGSPEKSVETRVPVDFEQAHLYIYFSGSLDTVFTAFSTGHLAAASQRVPKGGHRRSRLRRLEDGKHLARHGHQKHNHRPHSLDHVATMAAHKPGPGGAPQGDDLPSFFGLFASWLRTDYSDLRTGDATWLVSSIVSGVVDSYAVLLEAYRARLRWYQHNLDEHADVELLSVKQDLEHMVHRLRPMGQIVSRLASQDCFASEVRFHVEGAGDHLAQLLHGIGNAMEICAALREEVKAQKEERENHSGFHVTVMVTLLLPLQLLTGVYGMNFVDEDGKGAVPLLGTLSLENSYLLFWGLGIGLTILLALWFRCAHLL